MIAYHRQFISPSRDYSHLIPVSWCMPETHLIRQKCVICRRVELACGTCNRTHAVFRSVTSRRSLPTPGADETMGDGSLLLGASLEHTSSSPLSASSRECVRACNRKATLMGHCPKIFMETVVTYFSPLQEVWSSPSLGPLLPEI